MTKKKFVSFAQMDAQQAKGTVRDIVKTWGWKDLTPDEENGLYSAMLVSLYRFHPSLMATDSNEGEKVSLQMFL